MRRLYRIRVEIDQVLFLAESRRSNFPPSARRVLGDRRLEGEAHRVRTVPNGPRTLDVDVLLVGDLVVDDPDLVVPHPRMWQRRFVLEPLADLAPELVPPSVRIASGGDVRLLGKLPGY